MNPIHILLVEDNEGDILLTTEALQEGKILTKMTVARDGKQAIDILSKKGEHANAELPSLVLLDINLPKKNGHEVLQFIKTNDKLKHLPVIMLTTSSSERDISLAYSNYANCYITKPVDVGEFMDAVLKMEDFWLHIVKLPNH